MSKKKDVKIGLALGGGGVRGAMHIGFYEVLKENNIPIAAVAGTSMGAIIGGGIALGYPPKAMKEFAKHYEDLNLLSFGNFNYFNESIVKGDSVARIIGNFFGGKTFAETKIPFACTSVDLESRQEYVLTEGSLATATQASSSYPIVFPPVFYNDRYLVDGALLDPVPANVVREMGADKVIAISIKTNVVRQHIAGHIFMKHYKDKYAEHFSGPDDAKNDQKGISKFAKKLFKEKFGDKFDSKKEDLKFMVDILIESMAIAGQGNLEKKLNQADVDLLLEPSISVGWLDFDKVGDVVDMGRDLAKEALPKIKEWLGME